MVQVAAVVFDLVSEWEMELSDSFKVRYKWGTTQQSPSPKVLKSGDVIPISQLLRCEIHWNSHVLSSLLLWVDDPHWYLYVIWNYYIYPHALSYCEICFATYGNIKYYHLEK